MDKLDFLDGSEEPNEELAPEVIAEAPEPTPEPQPEPEPVAPEPEPAPQPVAQPEPGHVPLAAMLEERDKRKALEEQLRALQSQQHEPEDVPDVLEDPQGFRQGLSREVQQLNYQTRLHFSEKLAASVHGAETFAKAKEWGIERCNADPHFNARVASSIDPYEIVVAEYLKDQIASKVTLSDFEAYQAWKAAQEQAAAMQPAAEAAQPAPAPSRSLASAPSAGGAAHVPTGPGQAFDSLFQ